MAEDLLSFGDRALHPVWTWSEDDFRAESKQQHAPLQAHGVGHRQDEFVSSHRRHESQADAGVAAGGLDQHGFAGLNFPRPFGFGDHADANAILYAGARIRALQFRYHLGSAAFGHFVQPDERRVTDQLGDVICDLHNQICPPGIGCSRF